MLFTEYNEEVHIKNEKNISYENGYGKGYGTGYGKGYGNGYDCGIKDVNELYSKLIGLGRIADMERALSDEAFRDELMKELFPDKSQS